MTRYILLVDDSELIRLATRHFLESQTAFKVCGEAVDGIDALEKASHLNPDLIILDIAMPRMNGLQTARELRARMYGGANHFGYLVCRRGSAWGCGGSRDHCGNFQIKSRRATKSR